MSVAQIQFKPNPDTRFEINRSENVLESQVKELFDKHIYYVMRYMGITNGPITFKAASEKLTAQGISTVFKAFGKVIECKNELKVNQEPDHEETKAEDDDFLKFLTEEHREEYILEKSEELQKAKVVFEEAKKATGIEIEFRDL